MVGGNVTRDRASVQGKRTYVQRIFSEIAPRYDLLNRLLSLGIDRRWRKVALKRLSWTQSPRGLYLDLCAGTLDVGTELSRREGFEGKIVGADFAQPMLQAGVGKAPRDVLVPVVADAMALPFRTDAFDGAIVAFGIRNVADLGAGLREVHRVLKPGARFVILEFSTPRAAVVRLGYGLYSRLVLPAVGRLVSGHPTAYSYLPDSVARFPDAPALGARLQRAGFTRVTWETPTFGVVAIHVGVRE